MNVYAWEKAGYFPSVAPSSDSKTICQLEPFVFLSPKQRSLKHLDVVSTLTYCNGQPSASFQSGGNTRCSCADVTVPIVLLTHCRPHVAMGRIWWKEKRKKRLHYCQMKNKKDKLNLSFCFSFVCILTIMFKMRWGMWRNWKDKKF